LQNGAQEKIHAPSYSVAVQHMLQDDSAVTRGHLSALIVKIHPALCIAGRTAL